ncbi:MAG: 2-C-methyl-D-erythritol 2,4-cyclodiphosphate synthase [Clostridia bacterium]|nr:2-C-methyl-D-erythritol 2,4-cyclodiphosphate synthase [Clostridia bacterium]
MYNNKTASAVIVAAGSGTRMGRDKLLIDLCGKTTIVRSVQAFKNTGFFDEIILVASEKNIDAVSAELENHHLSDSVRIILGGSSRGESSFLGINAAKGEYVLIHDGARPLVSAQTIEGTLSACIKRGAAAAGVKSKDTIKQVSPQNIISSTVPRESAVLIQTPQGFKREKILKAYNKHGFNETDDCSLMEKMGASIAIVEGSYENLKLTTAEDVVTAEGILRKRGEGRSVAPMRIGTGFDTHRLVENRDLIIGGVKIPYEKGLLGHSDADVLIHAVIDALFGAAALGDIGTHFPDTDEKYKGASSMLLLEEAARLIHKEGYEIGNIDATIIAQKPKMAPHTQNMCQNIADAVKTDVSRISIKAKTNEQMGFTGRGEGIEARAVALLYRI